MPLASVTPQVLALQEKLDADGPVIWNPTLAIDALPVLVMVRATGAPAVPIA
jgi:hypothetical protein